MLSWAGPQLSVERERGQFSTEVPAGSAVTTIRVPGEIKRSRDLRGGRWSWTLNLAQKRSRVGRWSWAKRVGLPLLELSKLFVNSGATDIVFVTAQAQQLKQQLRSAQVAGQLGGDTALTLPLFWRRSTVSPIFFGRFPRSSLHSVVPFPLCPRP